MENELDIALVDDAMGEFLEHHGIKGMKHGVRRTPAQLGHVKGGYGDDPRKGYDENPVPTPRTSGGMRGTGSTRTGSGRVYGNGEDAASFVNSVKDLRSSGISEVQIARLCGYTSTTQYRAAYSRAMNEEKDARDAEAKSMIESGMSRSEVCNMLGVNESTLRLMLKRAYDPNSKKITSAEQTANILREVVDRKGMVDVGAGVEREVLNGVSREKMDQALQILREEGYKVLSRDVSQATNPDQNTTFKILATSDKTWADTYNYDQISSFKDYEVVYDETGSPFVAKRWQYPASLDSSRLLIRTATDIMPDGHEAVEKDGTIEIRRGVADLSLGNSKYAQVRIMVDNQYYLKGMACYSDDLPDGIDIAFNTNKSSSDPAKALKKIKDDPLNPFGTLLRRDGAQYMYQGDDGEQHLGLVNKCRQEGDWGEWGDSIASQFLSKQNQRLIDDHLAYSIDLKRKEFEEIMSITNPVIRKNELETFASTCDSTATHLNAAALPGCKYQVIGAIPTLNDNEIYAPQFKDGQTLALVRFPHGGTFEIVVGKVNNKNTEGRSTFGPDAKDLVGVNARNAAKLSGADFDGDTVMTIPCNDSMSSTRITSRPMLEELAGFDPKDAYPEREGMDYMKYNKYVLSDGRVVKNVKPGDMVVGEKEINHTQKEMGIASNLITDMTMFGASDSEMARAVKYSMVAIDAAKHKLDYKRAYSELGIQELKDTYQGHINESGKFVHGASTLLSSASGEVLVPRTQGEGKINEKGKSWYDPNRPEGELIYKIKENDTFISPKTGKVVTRTKSVSRMSTVDDARVLSRGTDAEESYAKYANEIKQLARDARLAYAHTETFKVDPEAAKKYKDQVDYLTYEYNEAAKNAPRERMAQLYAAQQVKAANAYAKENGEELSKKQITKLGTAALQEGRDMYGASRRKIIITDDVWEAIQAHAISNTLLEGVLRFADGASLKTRSMPKQHTNLTPGQLQRIEMYRNATNPDGSKRYTIAQIADAIGVSTSTINRAITLGEISE